MKETSLLTRELTIEEQQDILWALFTMNFNDKVLYDEDGEEFYGRADNAQWDFSTLAGIFSYNAHLARKRGERDKIWEIRKALRIP